MRNRTVMFQKKKIELGFEIGPPVNVTQFSKTATTKNYTFLILVDLNISKY